MESMVGLAGSRTSIRVVVEIGRIYPSREAATVYYQLRTSFHAKQPHRLNLNAIAHTTGQQSNFLQKLKFGNGSVINDMPLPIRIDSIGLIVVCTDNEK